MIVLLVSVDDFMIKQCMICFYHLVSKKTSRGDAPKVTETRDDKKNRETAEIALLLSRRGAPYGLPY